ncbi:hypothetical protein BDV93DRAFT_566029 [Ceratobasidium sp. AG-I]|nr:hypothetical protein BDV93DRAFT_566029 [Ceratobasidium sp. AG-I]
MKLFASIRLLGLFVAAVLANPPSNAPPLKSGSVHYPSPGLDRSCHCVRTPRSRNLNPPLKTASYSESYDQIAPTPENSTYSDVLVNVYVSPRGFSQQSVDRHRTLGYPSHMDLNPVIHFTSLGAGNMFHPEWTNALRPQCGYKGVAPRKDFSINPSYDYKPQNQTMHENELNLGNAFESGLGAFGDPNEYPSVRIFYSDKQLTIFSATPFSRQEVSTSRLPVLRSPFLLYFFLPHPHTTTCPPNYHNFRRKYSPHPGFGGFSNVSANSTFNPQEVANLLAQPEGTYNAFWYHMEQIVGMHSTIHGTMGGQNFMLSACLS